MNLRSCVFAVWASCFAWTANAQDVRFDAELWLDRFVDTRAGAPKVQRRFKFGAEGTIVLSEMRLTFDADILSSPDRSDDLFLNAAAALSGGDAVSWSIGLLRDEWGKTEQLLTNALVAPNLTFGATTRSDPIAQPGIRLATTTAQDVQIELVAHLGLRTGPLPQADDRGGFGVYITEIRTEEDMGSGALAARLSGSGAALDWSTYLFHGLSRSPTFVAVSPNNVDAVYDEVTQFGFDLEAAPGDWRLFAEGAYRWNGRDVSGARIDHALATIGIEYQYFSAFGGAADVIFGGELRHDSRGELADLPFASGAGLGLSITQSQFLGWEADYLFLFDRYSDATGHELRIVKPLADDPRIEIELGALTFSDGGTPGVVSVFKQDRQFSIGLRSTF